MATCSGAPGFVANTLSGARIHRLPGGRAVVPLLHPQQHGLPFLLTLELHAATPATTAAPPPPAPTLDRALYSLHYVLAGSGQLERSAGGTEELQAGDAVLMHTGAAGCRATAAPQDHAAAHAAAGLPAGSPWQLAELVAYMPQELFEQQQKQQQEGRQGQAQQGGDSGRRQADKRQRQQEEQRQRHEASARQRILHSPLLQPLVQPQPISSAGGSSTAVDGGEQLPAEFVSALLAGARDTARQLLLQQEQGAAHLLGGSNSHDGSISGSSNSSSSGDGGTASSVAHAPSSSSAGSHGWGALPLPPAVRAVVRSLAAWWEAQQDRTCPVTKRTLSELTAFRLPNQTNRLAVQFDPYSSPQVPFISGIEVFERGHRTTPHVHPQAHELFFILAGEGEGFCGEQRFPVAAGDVVVFRPGSVHGIDNSGRSRMYCLELMVPNEAFAEMVRAGEDTGQLSGDDLCVLAAIGCR